jgi:hypothetical protein
LNGWGYEGRGEVVEGLMKKEKGKEVISLVVEIWKFGRKNEREFAGRGFGKSYLRDRQGCRRTCACGL